jgi:release factor glutamine methyltransferase
VTLGEVLRRATEHLAKQGSETPRLDAELLLGHALGRSRIELYTEFERPLTEEELARYRELVRRRAKHEPVAYILGEWGFRRLRLTIDRRALIPRPETETVVERCLALIEGASNPDVLDVGVGSGAIALAIADEHRGARVTGIDASADALDLARENATRTGIDIRLEQRDLFENLPRGPWDLVVSNPPYVEPEELGTLMPDVRDWEPHEALVGRGATEAVSRGAVEILQPGGALVLEVADGQGANVSALLESLGYRNVRATADLAGRDRVVEGTR